MAGGSQATSAGISNGAVQDQIDATVEDAVNRARNQLPRGAGLAH